MGTAAQNRLGFYLYADWLPDMGFVHGALVQAIPEQNEIVFNLCDDNITKYSELDAQTKSTGGKLIQVYTATVKNRHSPTLLASGQFVKDVGWVYKDILIAQYVHGKIRVRKLPDNVRVITVVSRKELYTDKQFPKVRLTGEWLAQYGFVADSLVAVASEHGSITFKLCDDGIEKYSELVRHARRNKLKLLQVKEAIGRDKLYPYIKITGSSVEQAKFAIGNTLIATCKHGCIQLQTLDLAGLGF